MIHTKAFRHSLIALACCLGSAAASAQTSFEVVAPIDASGSVRSPRGGVIKASNGALYGTGHDSGTLPQCGGVYKIATDGTFSVVHAFEGTDGCGPVGELVQGPDGHLYGTTTQGGPNVDQLLTLGTGTIFRISLPEEEFTMIHAFAGLDEVNGWYPEGCVPYGGLAVGNDGALYGITNGGGPLPAGSETGPGGTIFRITTAGVLTVLHTLVAGTDGSGSNAGLNVGPDGNFYGTTAYGGGVSGAGTIFRVTSDGVFTKLFTFTPDGTNHPNGFQPLSEPVMDVAGNLYGTASAGGPAGTGAGTVWRLSPGGVLTVLKAFSGDAATDDDGTFPLAGLTLGSDGSVYGTTSGGGLHGNGTVFRITPAGVYEVLHSFDIAADGGDLDGRLLEISRHVFLGTARLGGASSGGAVFKLSLPVVDIDANDADGPLTLGAGDELRLSVSFDAFAAGLVNPARLYIGVVSPFGLLWLTGSGFTATPGALYTGPLPTFAPATLLTIPDAAALPAGSYLWFIVVDTDGTGDTFDYVELTVGP